MYSGKGTQYTTWKGLVIMKQENEKYYGVTMEDIALNSRLIASYMTGIQLKNEGERKETCFGTEFIFEELPDKTIELLACETDDYIECSIYVMNWNHGKGFSVSKSNILGGL